MSLNKGKLQNFVHELVDDLYLRMKMHQNGCFSCVDACVYACICMRARVNVYIYMQNVYI